MSSGCHIMLHVNVRHIYVISHRYMRYMTSATHSGYRMSRQIYDIHYSCRMQTYMWRTFTCNIHLWHVEMTWLTALWIVTLSRYRIWAEELGFKIFTTAKISNKFSQSPRNSVLRVPL